LRSRNLARGLAHSQPLNDLTNFEHLKPPESHRVSPRKIPEDNAIKKSKTAKNLPQPGSIWPQPKWLYAPANSHMENVLGRGGEFIGFSTLEKATPSLSPNEKTSKRKAPACPAGAGKLGACCGFTKSSN
jgi:hypothetical protein